MENPHILEDITEIVREEGIIERTLPHWTDEHLSRGEQRNTAGFCRVTIKCQI